MADHTRSVPFQVGKKPASKTARFFLPVGTGHTVDAAKRARERRIAGDGKDAERDKHPVKLLALRDARRIGQWGGHTGADRVCESE